MCIGGREVCSKYSKAIGVEGSTFVPEVCRGVQSLIMG